MFSALDIVIVAVSLSDVPEKWDVKEIPFYCHTEGYDPNIRGHDNNDINRLTYLTKRYNSAVTSAIEKFRELKPTHILLCEKYYVKNVEGIERLLKDYRVMGEDNAVMGASIWCKIKVRIRPFIIYYDTLSVRELRGIKYYGGSRLPKGLMRVSGVGCCWIFPLDVWRNSGGFTIPIDEPQAGGSRCLSAAPRPVFLDCSARFWRTPADSDVPEYSLSKRLRVSAGGLKRKLISSCR